MSTADVRGRFIWHELLTTDTAGAAAFYPRVVPWRTQPSSMPGYTLWMAGQTQIGGLTALPQEAGGPPPHWLIYVGTPSVDASCLQAQSLGAKVLLPVWLLAGAAAVTLVMALLSGLAALRSLRLAEPATLLR